MKRISETTDIPVGISACVMGEQVRFNGGHSQSKICQVQLAKHFQFEPFCPEVAAGFGIPRPTMRLTGNPDDPDLIFSRPPADGSNEPEADLSKQLMDACQPMLERCQRLDGFILKKDSPSCGMERVKIYQPSGHPHEQRGSGLFARALMQRFPNLPIEEDGRLNDAQLRENFVMRVFAHHNFRTEVTDQPSFHKLLQFHSSYKYLLMAHNQTAYRELGKMLAVAHNEPLDALLKTYHEQFMSAISTPASRGSHCNVMQHIMGYLKQSVDSSARQDILNVFEQYRVGEVNLITPMTLLSHYINQNGSEYIRAQRYLEPYPAHLGLRNQV
ncbi:Uncharacterized conserved protein YbgA, DUF1722 family [Amphritea atlantica]|uniref:Uncharacterized conserved protein YbgA, DUF1722 family n=1 Tax=Amphritea atlantica TaxID=355243 RepID=A0A1H9GPB9_9GAMM|nr:DUF523 and DUF1722 domain-containing protein [Amphritea atlantica]SEQ51962.1 Uncharacterized conserved protein YbgA, DUF1722 family [Amphritea atlantica]